MDNWKELTVEISGLEEAKAFVRSLSDRRLIWHFEDDIWECFNPGIVSIWQLTQMDKRRDELYNDNLDWSEYGGCPIGYCLKLMDL